MASNKENYHMKFLLFSGVIACHKYLMTTSYILPYLASEMKYHDPVPDIDMLCTEISSISMQRNCL